MTDQSPNIPEGLRPDAAWIQITAASQQLTLFSADETLVFQCRVSTAAKGLGESMNSLKTPRGWHQIRACIGAGVPENGVFSGRRFTGEVYTSALASADPQRDWVLTRILWLSGLQPGFNRLGNHDTMRRYIYIHGTPESNPMGSAHSHGCIRLHNTDLLQLYDLVHPGTRVCIVET